MKKGVLHGVGLGRLEGVGVYAKVTDSEKVFP